MNIELTDYSLPQRKCRRTKSYSPWSKFRIYELLRFKESFRWRTQDHFNRNIRCFCFNELAISNTCCEKHFVIILINVMSFRCCIFTLNITTTMWRVFFHFMSACSVYYWMFLLQKITKRLYILCSANVYNVYGSLTKLEGKVQQKTRTILALKWTLIRPVVLICVNYW